MMLRQKLNYSAKNEKVKKGILDLLEQEKVLDLVIEGVKKIRGGEKLSTSDKFSHGKETLSFVDLAKRCCFLSTDAKDKRKSMEDALGVKFELKPSKKVKTSKSETEKVGGDKNKKGWGKEDPGMY
jgi:hypothetical protein